MQVVPHHSPSLRDPLYVIQHAHDFPHVRDMGLAVFHRKTDSRPHVPLRCTTDGYMQACTGRADRTPTSCAIIRFIHRAQDSLVVHVGHRHGHGRGHGREYGHAWGTGSCDPTRPCVQARLRGLGVRDDASLMSSTRGPAFSSSSTTILHLETRVEKTTWVYVVENEPRSWKNPISRMSKECLGGSAGDFFYTVGHTVG